MTGNQRYTRQIVLPEIGADGQKKLTRAKVLVIGAGGLGCPALQYLAAAGIGIIGIVDDDVVDITNLQRQVLFTEGDKGQSKAETAKERLSALNPDVKINAYNERLSTNNVFPLFDSYDIVIDGTDNFPAKFLINDAAVKQGKPVVYGSILGFEGQVCVFDAKNGPCYRCLHPAPPYGHIPNCAEAGVIGALAGMIGSIQAMEAIKLIVGTEALKPLVGTLWTINARTMETQSYNIPKNPQCPVCSRKPENIELKDEAVAVCAAIPEIDAAKARTMQDAVFIDVREQNEWDEGHIEGAVLCPLSILQTQTPAEIPSDRPCIIYCQKGLRGQQAAALLTERGYTNIMNMRGGYEAWCECSDHAT